MDSGPEGPEQSVGEGPWESLTMCDWSLGGLEAMPEVGGWLGQE